MDAALNANEKVNRAIHCGAYAIGTEGDVQELPG